MPNDVLTVEDINELIYILEGKINRIRGWFKNKPVTVPYERALVRANQIMNKLLEMRTTAPSEAEHK